MRRRNALTRLACACLALATTCALAAGFVAPVPASAADAPASDAPAVVYDAQTGAFTYRNAPEGDLFPAFKGLVPGDVALQQLSVEAVNVTAPVSLYVGAYYEDAAVEGIEDVSLVASFSGSDPHRGTLGDRHHMGESVLLATFSEDGTVSGAVRIEIPTGLSNGTAGSEHVLAWTFTAQEEGASVPPAQGGGDSEGSFAAQTGDVLFGALFALSAAAVVSSLVLIGAWSRMRGSRKASRGK